MKTSQDKIGKQVKEARERVKPRLSRQEFAKRLKAAGLDVTPAAIVEIEAGHRSLNYYQISVIASVLDTTVNQILS
ncbi:MAG: hypothetical protein WCI20_01785 [bacterium]